MTALMIMPRRHVVRLASSCARGSWDCSGAVDFSCAGIKIGNSLSTSTTRPTGPLVSLHYGNVMDHVRVPASRADGTSPAGLGCIADRPMFSKVSMRQQEQLTHF